MDIWVTEFPQVLCVCNLKWEKIEILFQWQRKDSKTPSTSLLEGKILERPVILTSYLSRVKSKEKELKVRF